MGACVSSRITPQSAETEKHQHSSSISDQNGPSTSTSLFTGLVVCKKEGNISSEEDESGGVDDPLRGGKPHTPTNKGVLIVPGKLESFLGNACQSLLDVLKIYGLKSGKYIEDCVQRTVRTWAYLIMSQPEAGTFCERFLVSMGIKFLKYKLNQFFAYWVDSGGSLPLEYGDSGQHLLCGRVDRWLSYKLKYLRARNYEAFIGLLMSLKLAKRDFDRPDTFTADLSVCKTWNALTEEPPRPRFLTFGFVEPYLPQEFRDSIIGVPPSLYDLEIDEICMDSLFRFFVRKVMKGCEPSPNEILSPILPSRSATYSNSRGKLGFFGDIMGCDKSTGYDFLPTMFEFDQKFNTGANFRLFYEGPELFDDYCSHRTILVDDSLAISSFCSLREDLWNEIMKKEVFESRMCAIIEALKVRTVTAGDGAACFLLKPAQTRLHRFLSSRRQFITGNPETPENLYEAVGDLEEGEQFVSVDYEASTDNLLSKFSVMALEELESIGALTSGEAALGIRTIQGTTLYFHGSFCENDPEEKVLGGCCGGCKKLFENLIKSQQGGVMRRGQLMGHILSFPLLCLANGFALWCSRMVSTHKYIDPLSCDFAVNGDDGVFRGTQEAYLFWQMLGTNMGLKPSVGKVYINPRWFDFNSSCFVYDEELELPVQRVKFVPVGVCKGKNRTGESSNITELIAGDRAFTFNSIIEYIVKRSPDDLVDSVLAYFVKHTLFNSEIYGVINGAPWFIPICFGGIGIKPLYESDGITYRTVVRENGEKFTFGPERDDIALGNFVKRYLEMGGKSIPGLGERGVSFRTFEPEFPIFGKKPEEAVDYRTSVDSAWELYSNPQRFQILYQKFSKLTSSKRFKDGAERRLRLRILKRKRIIQNLREKMICEESFDRSELEFDQVLNFPIIYSVSKIKLYERSREQWPMCHAHARSSNYII